MATIWQSTKKAEPGNTFSGTDLSSWTRQQKLATIAGFAILGILLALSACSKQQLSKQAPKPATSVSSSALASASLSAPSPAGAPNALAPAEQAPIAKVKKAAKKHLANVTYNDPNYGVSFIYPRKFALLSGDKAQPALAGDAVPMNFIQPGGIPVATVVLPDTLYPGTDFAAGFFSLNVNRSLPEQECSHFAFADTSEANGEPISAQKVKVGATDMQMTSEFAGSATQQLETQYYHNYESGACYEYILGLGTAGYGAKAGIEPVNREEVFARLQKILSTVKTHPVAPEQVAEQTVAASASPK